MLGIKKALLVAVLSFENQRYQMQMVLPSGGRTLLEPKYESSKRYIYPLTDYTHPIPTNSSNLYFQRSKSSKSEEELKTCLQTLLVKSYVAEVHNIHLF